MYTRRPPETGWLDTCWGRATAGRSDHHSFRAPVVRADTGFRAGENAGNSGDALQVPPRIPNAFGRVSNLYRRSQLEDDQYLRPSRAHDSPAIAASAIDERSRTVHFERRNSAGRAAALGTGLRALEWDDDTKNALQYSCAPINRESAAFDLFCRLCQPGNACRSSTGRWNKWRGCP